MGPLELPGLEPGEVGPVYCLSISIVLLLWERGSSDIQFQNKDDRGFIPDTKGPGSLPHPATYLCWTLEKARQGSERPDRGWTRGSMPPADGLTLEAQAAGRADLPISSHRRCHAG